MPPGWPYRSTCRTALWPTRYRRSETSISPNSRPSTRRAGSAATDRPRPHPLYTVRKDPSLPKQPTRGVNIGRRFQTKTGGPFWVPIWGPVSAPIDRPAIADAVLGPRRRATQDHLERRGLCAAIRRSRSDRPSASPPRILRSTAGTSPRARRRNREMRARPETGRGQFG